MKWRVKIRIRTVLGSHFVRPRHRSLVPGTAPDRCAAVRVRPSSALLTEAEWNRDPQSVLGVFKVPCFRAGYGAFYIPSFL